MPDLSFKYDPLPPISLMEAYFIPEGIAGGTSGADRVQAHAWCQHEELYTYEGERSTDEGRRALARHLRFRRDLHREAASEAEGWRCELAAERARAIDNLIERYRTTGYFVTAEWIVRDGEWTPPPDPTPPPASDPEPEAEPRVFRQPWEFTGITKEEWDEQRRQKINRIVTSRREGYPELPDEERRGRLQREFEDGRFQERRAEVTEIRESPGGLRSFNDPPVLHTGREVTSHLIIQANLRAFKDYLAPHLRAWQGLYRSGGISALEQRHREIHEDMGRRIRERERAIREAEADARRALAGSDDEDLLMACLTTIQGNTVSRPDSEVWQEARRRAGEIHALQERCADLYAQNQNIFIFTYRARHFPPAPGADGPDFAPLFDLLLPTDEEIEAMWEAYGLAPRCVPAPATDGRGNVGRPAIEDGRPEWLGIDVKRRRVPSTPSDSLGRVLAFLAWALLRDSSLERRGGRGRIGLAWQEACEAFDDARGILHELRPQPGGVDNPDTLAKWRDEARAWIDADSLTL